MSIIILDKLGNEYNLFNVIINLRCLLMTFGEILKNLRKENGFTRNDLASKLNISYSAIAKYESNTRCPDSDTLKKIAELFKVSTDYLLNNTSQDITTEQIMLEYNSLSEESKRDFEKFLELLKIKDAKDKNKDIDEKAQ